MIFIETLKYCINIFSQRTPTREVTLERCFNCVFDPHAQSVTIRTCFLQSTFILITNRCKL